MKLSNMYARIKDILCCNRTIVLGIKYIPVVSVMLLTLHVGLLLLGWHEVITVGLSAVLMVLLLILLSIKFNFCPLHKALIAYMAIMTLCICIQRGTGFGEILTAVRLILFTIGIVLTALAINKFRNNGCD